VYFNDLQAIFAIADFYIVSALVDLLDQNIKLFKLILIHSEPPLSIIASVDSPPSPLATSSIVFFGLPFCGGNPPLVSCFIV
jgi:hypothetical protein